MNSDQIIDFWEDVFKTCEDRGIMKPKLPKCRCSDPNQCETWCFAKNKLIQDTCLHRNTKTQVIESIVNCETTIIICQDCGMKLTQPKIECR